DLERCRATLTEPLSVVLDAGHAFNTPPPTQGLASLIILALFERLRIGEGEGFDHIHGLVEATKRAFGVRDRVITDPDDLPHPVDRYLDAKFLDAEALTIDRRKAARWPVPAGEGGTVWMGAADASGLVVSYVQSLYWEFGSGVVLPKPGVLMQTRGASFSLDGGALTALEPAGCRPIRSIRRSPCSPMVASSATAPWAGMVSRRRKRRYSRGTCATECRSTARSTPRAGCWGAPGARRAAICAWKRASTARSSTACCRPATTW